MFPRHLIQIEGLSLEQVEKLLSQALDFADGDVTKSLAGKVQFHLFYQPSTRTNCSFAMAGTRLGADVIFFPTDFSAEAKGESFLDTVATLDAMGADIIVLRHPTSGMVGKASQVLKSASLVNAGDGQKSHPTQALTDLLTLSVHVKKSDWGNLCVAICGDVKNSRVARSQVQLFRLFGIRVVLSSSQDLQDWGLENLPIEEAINQAHAVIVLRPQEANDTFSQQMLTWELVQKVNKDVFIMHPGPVNWNREIDIRLANHPNSLVNKQVRLGVFIRMACLNALFNKSSNKISEAES